MVLDGDDLSRDIENDSTLLQVMKDVFHEEPHRDDSGTGIELETAAEETKQFETIANGRSRRSCVQFSMGLNERFQQMQAYRNVQEQSTMATALQVDEERKITQPVEPPPADTNVGPLTASEAAANSFETHVRLPYLRSLLNNLDHYFTDDPVMFALCNIFDPVLFPTDDVCPILILNYRINELLCRIISSMTLIVIHLSLFLATTELRDL